MQAKQSPACLTCFLPPACQDVLKADHSCYYPASQTSQIAERIMSEKQTGPRRLIKPRDGWSNIFTAQDCGNAQFGQGRLYEASYQDRPILRLVYNSADFELTGKAVLTVRCVLCGISPRGLGSHDDYPMIGHVEVGAIRLTLHMDTGRILNHLATQHDEDLGGVNDEDFFNSVLDCCRL
jgi:hypothetical protein